MPKACLTSGYKQDKSINSDNDTGAPFVVLQSVYTISTITAYEGLAAVRAFITEAYQSTDMKKVVRKRLEPKLAEELAAFEPHYIKFVKEARGMIVTLLKVLCECVECAIFQFGNLSAVLTSKGSVQNARDRYALNKVINGVECTMCIYVSGLMFTCVDVDVIEEVRKHLSDVFSDTHVHQGSICQSPVETVDFSQSKEVMVTMEGYVVVMLGEHKLEGCAGTSVTEIFFKIATVPF